MAAVYLSLGSNIGDRSLYLSKSRQFIEKHIGSIKAHSSVYETEPWGFADNTQFLNQIVEVETTLCSWDVLHQIYSIEKALGRKRGNKRYTSRTIDIDILFFDNEIINTPELSVPHPKIPDRQFVLIPMVEIASYFIHPQLKKSMKELLSECKDECRVLKINN